MPETFFADISAIGKIRISGQSAEDFIRTMTTVEPRAVAKPGQVAPALLMTSQAEIIDVIMVARTGDMEFMLTTNPDTGQEVFAWLEAHSQLADDQGAVFADLDISDQTDKLATLAIYGSDAVAILDELTNSSIEAKLNDVNLGIVEIGQLPVMLIKWPFLGTLGAGPKCPVFEIHLPAAANEQLQNLLLSFVEIDPESLVEYKHRRQTSGTWFDAANQPEYVKPETPALLRLIRDTDDFVGAQALKVR